MKVSMAVLCDAATVRDGLLNVLGAGVTHMWREDFPSPMQVTYAAMIVASPDEIRSGSSVHFSVVDDSGAPATEPAVAEEIPLFIPQLIGEGGTMTFPFVVDVRDVNALREGPVNFVLSADGQELSRLAAAAVISPEGWSPNPPSQPAPL